MPVYVAKCDKCNQLFDYSVLPSQRNEPQTCECGGVGYRNEEAEFAKPSNLDFEDHPRLSATLGVTDAEIETGLAYKRHPGANFVKHPKLGWCLEIKNRQEKIQRCKEAGLIELD